MSGPGSVPRVLAPSHGCWPHQGHWALTKAPAAECLESLKKVRIPPSSTVQEELQFFLGSRGGHTGGQQGPCPLCAQGSLIPAGTTGAGMLLPDPLPLVHRPGPVEHPGFFEALQLEGKGGGGGVRFDPALRGAEGPGSLPWCSPTFSSLVPGAGGTVRTPLSRLELLLARAGRPHGPWKGRVMLR